MTLAEAVAGIAQPDRAAMLQTKQRLDSIIKPLESLGRLEEHLIQIAGMTGRARFDLSRKAVAVFCADNGIVAQNVTQSTSEVTAIVAQNMATHDTCVCAMADVAGAQVIPVDIGVARDLDTPGILIRKVAYGTKDFSKEPAMTREQAVQALEAGIELAQELRAQGFGMLATGEMGIGNTTTSSAVAAVLMRKPVEEVTGRGAGLTTQGLARKIELICNAIMLHKPDPDDALDVLCKLGGFDIAGMAGLCIGAGVARVPVVLDGFISCVAAMVACLLAPRVKHFLLPSHVSAEPAGAAVLEHLGLVPLLHAGMRLGEGTGAVATFPLYDMIASVYDRMVDFSDENMQPYERLL